MFELHIWGPGFRLPSIDAECLATVIYLQRVLPHNSWSLVPSSNPDLNPYRRLPALRHDSNWTAGFRPIREYLIQHIGVSVDTDRDLDDVQAADCYAFTSFIESRCLPLLDLSLYVSSDNYHSGTQRVLGDLLTWPQSWTIPHHLRERAKRRSEHLGLSTLDVDIVQEEDNADTGIAAHIPKSLRKPKQTVGALLGNGTSKIKFRLDAVIDSALEPLSMKLSDRDWLIANTTTSVDCLAIAVISLMHVQELPQTWLYDALSSKYNVLGTWARKNTSAAFGTSTTIASVRESSVDCETLPWIAPSPSSWTETTILALESLVNETPLLRWGYEHGKLLEEDFNPQNGSIQSQTAYTNVHDKQRTYSQAIVAAMSAASLFGWLAHTGLLARSQSRNMPLPRKKFGEAGQILGL